MEKTKDNISVPLSQKKTSQERKAEKEREIEIGHNFIMKRTVER